MHFLLTSIRENIMATSKTPTGIIQCWGAARLRVMLKLQQIINERNPSTVAQIAPNDVFLVDINTRKYTDDFKDPNRYYAMLG